ncbi:MAG: hypothetical protein WBA17_15045 [Saprospiraceae bacterium]
MLTRYVFFSLLLSFAAALPAQLLMTNPQEISDDHRYRDSKGSAYLLPEFTAGTVYAADGTPTPVDKINYNAESGLMEVRLLNQYVELTPNEYPKVIFRLMDGTERTLVYGLHPVLSKAYGETIHEGEKGTAIAVQRVKEEIKVVQTPGKATEMRNLVATTEDYLLIGQDLRRVRRNPKSLAEALGRSEDELKQQLKKAKVKLKKDEGYQQALELIL